jgi:hypothetical protein
MKKLDRDSCGSGKIVTMRSLEKMITEGSVERFGSISKPASKV